MINKFRAAQDAWQIWLMGVGVRESYEFYEYRCVFYRARRAEGP